MNCTSVKLLKKNVERLFKEKLGRICLAIHRNLNKSFQVSGEALETEVDRVPANTMKRLVTTKTHKPPNILQGKRINDVIFPQWHNAQQRFLEIQ